MQTEMNAAKTKSKAQKSQPSLTCNANTQPPPICPLCQRTFLEQIRPSGYLCPNCYTRKTPPDASPSTFARQPTSIIKYNCAPDSSSHYPASTAVTPVPISTAHNPDAPSNLILPTANISDVDSVHKCRRCNRTFTSHIGLVRRLRIHYTQTGEPLSRTPTCTRRIRLQCPLCLRTFADYMGLLRHMRIHGSGIHHSLYMPRAPT
nr:unnamed protein product [Spirometra erinaceieuropaei]